MEIVRWLRTALSSSTVSISSGAFRWENKLGRSLYGTRGSTHKGCSNNATLCCLTCIIFHASSPIRSKSSTRTVRPRAIERWKIPEYGIGILLLILRILSKLKSKSNVTHTGYWTRRKCKLRIEIIFSFVIFFIKLNYIEIVVVEIVNTHERESFVIKSQRRMCNIFRKIYSNPDHIILYYLKNHKSFISICATISSLCVTLMIRM